MAAVAANLGEVLENILHRLDQLEHGNNPILHRLDRLEQAAGNMADGGTPLQEQLATVTNMVQQLATAGQQKADVNSVPTNSQLQQLTAQFRQLTTTVQQKANLNSVPTSAQFQQLTSTVQQKANVNSVPTYAQFQQLTSTVQQKANVNSVPTNAEFQQAFQRRFHLHSVTGHGHQANNKEGYLHACRNNGKFALEKDRRDPISIYACIATGRHFACVFQLEPVP
mmetsp:Transcript_44001/g.82268  ORF Transcript_44001/g.82268 Transcript_44001/m.82268 type:complete len:225 (+) Transcript_44001:94-768(+)